MRQCALPLRIEGASTQSANSEPLLFHMESLLQSVLPAAQPSKAVRIFSWEMVRV
ncbi:hypothetical protein [Streptomyces sp. ok210]|uniref:hypothetical protein n=1 Tax=Streptomyces sp. ok210 TaxID=1761905 RepID=UPI0015A55BE8|nr:hypothetical protein [Streptomyces sp. ok210]